MKGWIRRTCVGCVVALALGGPEVQASTGGTITFVGAIVTPTCGGPDTRAASPDRGLHRCVVSSGQAPLPTSSYRQEVAMLESSAGNDRLLAYFSGYADASNTRILTRTYE
jgi:type 1 fimbria pilin